MQFESPNMNALITLVLTCVVSVFAAATPKDFELRVIRPGDDDIFFVRNYTNAPILISDLAYDFNGPPVVGPALFHFDECGNLRSSRTNDYVSVQTWQAYEERKLTLLYNDTVSYPCFHKQDGYLAHDGNTTFYSCNLYPYDKYVDYLSLDEECFLATPVQLRLVYPI